MSFTYTLTDNSVVILGDDFVPKTMPATHPAFGELVKALNDNDPVTVQKLMDLPNAISSFMQGKIQIVDRQLFYDGRPLHNSLTTKILQFMDEGQDELAKPLINFLEKVKMNPSRRAAEGLYDWTVRSGLPITPEGDILAWKIVREDYKDYHSGRFDNSVGQVVEVPRNEVDEDADRTCSYGLHFCSTAYLPHYYSTSNRRVMVVKLHPADVVAFPRDYNISKGRACRYEVIGEVPPEKAKDFFPSVVSTYGGSYTDNELDNTGPLDDEIELDRWYRMRNGDVVFIGDYNDDSDYPYAGLIDGDRHTWARYGVFSTVEDEHELDLVELLPVDFDPEQEERVERPRRKTFWEILFGSRD